MENVTLYKSFVAIHLITMVIWMCGLIYILKLFSYHAGEKEVIVKDRFLAMEKKLMYFITLPSMTLSVIFGFSLLSLMPILFHTGWMHMKLFLIFLLIGITLLSLLPLKEFSKGRSLFTQKTFRMLSEIPTIFLILVIFLAVLKPF